MDSWNSRLLRQETRHGARAVVLDAAVRLREFRRSDGGAPSAAILEDGSAVGTGCIRCEDAPCLKYRPAELTIEGVLAFPADLDPHVCPTGALSYPREAVSPQVNPDGCIGCGLCVARCPVAAIHIDNGKAVVSSGVERPWIEVARDDQVALAAFRDSLAGVQIIGPMQRVNETTMGAALDGVSEQLRIADTQFPNRLTRNLFLSLDIGAAMRRRGDVNVRMDAVLALGHGTVGVAEVEFDQNVMLDGPRNIMDAIAVIVARYDSPQDQLRAAIVGLALPNQRSEFWQIIEDIDAVLGLKINTITVGGMIAALWRGATLPSLRENSLHTAGVRSIRAPLVAAVPDLARLPIGFRGMLESHK